MFLPNPILRPTFVFHKYSHKQFIWHKFFLKQASWSDYCRTDLKSQLLVFAVETWFETNKFIQLKNINTLHFSHTMKTWKFVYWIYDKCIKLFPWRFQTDTFKHLRYNQSIPRTICKRIKKNKTHNRLILSGYLSSPIYDSSWV